MSLTYYPKSKTYATFRVFRNKGKPENIRAKVENVKMSSEVVSLVKYLPHDMCEYVIIVLLKKHVLCYL